VFVRIVVHKEKQPGDQCVRQSFGYADIDIGYRIGKIRIFFSFFPLAMKNSRIISPTKKGMTGAR
jgi:hypothetical protein